MNFQTTKQDGRRIWGDMPHGKFTVAFDRSADGKDCKIVTADGFQVGTARIEFCEPVVESSDPAEAARQAPCCDQPQSLKEV